MQEVRSGRLLPGEKLGSIRQLASRFGVGRQVILSATEILSTESIIIKRSRQGTYINPNLSPELVRERTKRIGFLNWQILQPGLGAFSLRVYNEVLRMAPALNCEIFWQGMVDDLDPVNWFAGMRLDALLVTGRIDDALVALLQSRSIPYLIVGNYQFNLPANQLEKALAEDVSGAIRQLCQERHFTRLGTITNSTQLQSTRLYLAGAQLVAKELGLHYPEQWRYADAAENGYAGLQQLLGDNKDAPDIIYMTARAFPEAARYLFE
ncbi:MAG: GntR family transcriptional regulator, partial [Lentisphaerae bacterium]|nr:GntR family transcriptional regulator [Lentisphaerota bacterium]